MMAHVFALLLALADCGLTSGWTLQLETGPDPVHVRLHITNGSTTGAYLPTADDCYPALIVKRADTGELVPDLRADARCDVYHIFPGYYLAPNTAATKILVLKNYGVTKPGSYLVSAQDLIVNTESMGGCYTQLKINSNAILVTITAADLAKAEGDSL